VNLDFLVGYFGQIGYLGVFIVLFLCGMGLPIPEDITILASGYLVHLGDFKFSIALIVCMCGVLIGDLSIYTIGRVGGNRIVRHRIWGRLFTEARLNKAVNFFIRYGGKTIFIARFLPGLRAPTYLTAGLVKVSVIKFFILDFCAAIISVPLLLYSSYYFGNHIDTVISYATKTRYTLFVIIILAVIAYIIKYRITKKSKTTNI